MVVCHCYVSLPEGICHAGFSHLRKILPEKRQVHRWIHQSCHDVWSAIRMRWAGRISRTVFNRKKKILAELEAVPIFVTGKSMIWIDLKGIHCLQNPKLCNVKFGWKQKNKYTATCFVGGWNNPSTFVWSRSWQMTTKELWGPHKMTETKWVTRVITLLLGGYNSHL